MSECCFCYTTDKYYFLPTLLSAVQARKNISSGKADVLIIGFDFHSNEKSILQQIAAQYDVMVQFLEKGEINNLPIFMARHFLDAILDRRYTNVIHIDGDTQIYANVDPLIEAPLPSGRIFAAPDPMALLYGESDRLSRKTTAYLQSIGLNATSAARYVNSGIFRVARSDLKTLDHEIQKLCAKNLAHYTFTEQDAMNIAFGDQINLISMKWNYPAFFANFKYSALKGEHIKHFMSNPRPWHGPFMPWGKAGYGPYVDMISAHPQLRNFYRPMPKRTVLRYTAQQYVKKFIEFRVWQTQEIANKIGEFEKYAAV
ncbi:MULTISPECIES: glycosyltransferase [unclassified Methylobacterium]|uniref:glycosyltransferase family 8 protein n=1 Tax=unclassified Methylobacterium TaxID=2615210 RepID=UPI002269FE02|nr:MULTISPECIES: glycosyltransferase [unclassified Methylobacterium]